MWFLSLITAMAFGQILRAKWHWEKQEKIFILRTNKILQLRMLIKFFVLVPSAFMECMFCFLWFCLGIFIIWNTFWGCRKPKHIYCCSEHFFYYLSFIFSFRQYYSLLVTDGILFSAKKYCFVWKWMKDMWQLRQLHYLRMRKNVASRSAFISNPKNEVLKFWKCDVQEIYCST